MIRFSYSTKDTKDEEEGGVTEFYLLFLIALMLPGLPNPLP
jgi:hypothetical protein